MNYFVKYLFNDRSYWFRISLGGIAFIIMIDIVSYIYKVPGYFNLFFLKLFSVLGVFFGIIYMSREYIKEKKLKKIKISAPVFEKKREEKIREILKEGKELNTFCFECAFLNEETKGCKRDRIFERVKEITIEKKKYCLYWEKTP